MTLFLVTTTLPLVIGNQENVDINREGNSSVCTIFNNGVNYYVIDNHHTSEENIKSLNKGDNLLRNPSFEEGADDLPHYWTHYGVYRQEIYSWDNTQSFSGEKSVGISHLTYDEQGTAWFSEYLVPVDLINVRYGLSVYYKYNGEPNEDQLAWLDFSFYDGNKEPLRYAYGWGLPYSSEWTYSGLIEIYGYVDEFLKNDTEYLEIGLSFRNWDYPDDPVSPNPDIEVRFDDVFFGIEENNPPLTPTIEGPVSGAIDTIIQYNITVEDPDKDLLSVYVDWGDGTNSSWISAGFLQPNTPSTVTVNHTWAEKGDYIIKAKVKDGVNAESDWATLEVSMPKNKPYINSPFLDFLENHPHLFPLMRQMIGL